MIVFTKEINQLVHNFNESLSLTRNFITQDIEGSSCEDAGKAGNPSAQDRDDIIRDWKGSIRSGEWTADHIPDSGYEDIHSFMEGTLTERMGEAGKRLHTGHDPHDQVALDMKLIQGMRLMR